MLGLVADCGRLGGKSGSSCERSRCEPSGRRVAPAAAWGEVTANRLWASALGEIAGEIARDVAS